MLMEVYEDKRVIGWIIVSKMNVDTVEIIDFFIWPDKRNKGFGNLILDKYLKYEQSLGIKKIFGWLSLDDTRKIGWGK